MGSYVTANFVLSSLIFLLETETDCISSMLCPISRYIPHICAREVKYQTHFTDVNNVHYGSMTRISMGVCSHPCFADAKITHKQRMRSEQFVTFLWYYIYWRESRNLFMITNSVIPIVSIVDHGGSVSEHLDRDLSRKRIVCHWKDVRLCRSHPKYSDIYFIFLWKSWHLTLSSTIFWTSDIDGVHTTERKNKRWDICEI